MTEGLGGLLKSSRNNFRGKIEVSPQELDAVVRKIPVVMHPSESFPNVFLGLEALHQLNHLQVRDIDLGMLRQIKIFLRIANSLLEQVLGDLSPVLLWNYLFFLTTQTNKIQNIIP